MEHVDFYSMQDLVDVRTGVLPEFLGNVLEVFENHIRNCVLCTAKGFICEICDDKKTPSGRDRIARTGAFG